MPRRRTARPAALPPPPPPIKAPRRPPKALPCPPSCCCWSCPRAAISTSTFVLKSFSRAKLATWRVQGWEGCFRVFALPIPTALASYGTTETHPTTHLEELAHESLRAHLGRIRRHAGHPTATARICEKEKEKEGAHTKGAFNRRVVTAWRRDGEHSRGGQPIWKSIRHSVHRIAAHTVCIAARRHNDNTKRGEKGLNKQGAGGVCIAAHAGRSRIKISAW